MVSYPTLCPQDNPTSPACIPALYKPLVYRSQVLALWPSRVPRHALFSDRLIMQAEGYSEQ